MGKVNFESILFCSDNIYLSIIFMFGKDLFIRFTASAVRKLLSVHVFSYFPFGFEGRMWDLIVPVPGNCLSFYFSYLEI